MQDNIDVKQRKILNDLFYDQSGLNGTAVSYTISFAAATILAFRVLLQNNTYDPIQYSLAIVVILVGYGAAAGSEVKTNERIRVLEGRIRELEKFHEQGKN